MAVAGAAVCLADSGRGLLPAATFLCILAGLALIKGGKYFYGEAFARRNYLRDLAAGASFLLILGAVSAGVMLFAGAFDPAKAGICSAAAIAAFVLGILGMAYGIKYKQSAEGVLIGRAIGFADAETGLLSADGIYDAKGELSGPEVLFNIEPVEAGRNNRERFYLDVLCRCANPRGVRLEAGRSGFLGTALACFGLEQAKSPAAWDFHNVYSNLPDAVVPPLTKALEAGVIFTEETGLSRLSLKGKSFRLSFSLEGRSATDGIKQILVQAATLAAAFDDPRRSRITASVVSHFTPAAGATR